MPEVKQLVTKNEFNRFPIRNESARPSCLPNTFLSPSFAPGRGRRVSLGGGSFSSHVTEEKRTGLQPGISPLCGTAIPGCAPLSAPGVHRDSVLAAPSPTRHFSLLFGHRGRPAHPERSRRNH